MAEITEAFVAEHAAVNEFLTALSGLGVYLPIPEHKPGEALEFQFHIWQDMPGGGWTISDDKRTEITVERFKAAAKAIGGRWAKNDPKASGFDDAYYIFTNKTVQIAGCLDVKLTMARDLVCERKQVGTEKKVVKAQPAVQEHEVEIPVYERECKPLFAQADRELAESLDAIEGELV